MQWYLLVAVLLQFCQLQMLFCWLGLPLPVVLGMVQPLEKETFIFCCFEVPFVFVGLNFEVLEEVRFVAL